MRAGASWRLQISQVEAMLQNENDWRRAVEQSWVVRFPKQRLHTFGSTNISYYVVTEPIYQELQESKQEGVVRTGRVIAERPTIVTPTYAMSLDGFSDEAYEYFSHLARDAGPNSPGILYQYRNSTDKMDIVGGLPSEIAHRIAGDLDRREEDMSVVMVGVDEAWDVALLKFIYEFTSSSVAGNVQEMAGRGMLEPQARFRWCAAGQRSTPSSGCSSRWARERTRRYSSASWTGGVFSSSSRSAS